MADKQISDLTSASGLTDGSLFVIEQSGAALKANWGMMKNYISPGVAAQYSTSATYNVGDYVIYNEQLYRCTTAITTPENWTAAHWTAAVIGSDLTKVSNAVSEKMPFSLITGGTDGLYNGISFDWTGDECHVSGTSTGTAFNDIVGGTMEIPYPLERGKTYRLEMDGNNVDLQVYKWGSPTESLITTNTDSTFSIPSSGVNGIVIRLRVSSGLTVDETVHPKILSLSKTSDELNAENRLTTIRDCYPASSNQIVFSYSGSDISFTPPRTFTHFLGVDGKMYEYGKNNTDTFTVPHDSFAIYNIDANEIQVKTLNQLKALSGTSYVVLFYNSNGNVKGLFEKYAIDQKFSMNGDVFFYGPEETNGNPIFKRNSDNSIDVTIPANGRVNYTNPNNRTVYNGESVSNGSVQTINVPNDKCLVYNILDKTFSVKNATYDFSRSDVMLLYNSHQNANGPWYRFYLAQEINEKANGYPEYFESHIVSKAQAINTLLTGINGGAMVFVTDHHYPSNKMNSPGIVKAICGQTGINKVFLGGDFINREDTKAEALRNINRIGSMYEYPSVRTFRVVGNHEFNNPGASSDPAIVANQLTADELRYSILNTFEEYVTADPDTLSYYYDDTTHKIRYIVGAVTYKTSLDANSIKWVAQQMVNTPNDYSAVVIFHTILEYNNGTTSTQTSAANLVSALNAMKTHRSVTFGGSTYNFTGKTSELICAICGDMHVDTSLTTSDGVPIIATTTDSMQELGGLTRKGYETSEQAFDVFVFNKTTRKINTVRVGAGSDREFSF